MPILPSDPRTTFTAHRAEIMAAVQRVLESGRYILGEECAAFEREFAAYCGIKHAIGVANGTEAVQLGLMALGIKRGDAVITVSHTAVATVAAIEAAGATAVLVDVDEATFNMSPASLRDTLANLPAGLKPAAIVPVHLYGLPADMPEILSIANAAGVPVLEDAAQAHGAELDGRKAGSHGRIAAFSFYPTKNLGAFGDGGAVVTDDDALADRVLRLREYGWHERHLSAEGGINSRLDELQAAILRIKLQHLDAENAMRRDIAARYDAALAKTSYELPSAPAGSRHVYHQYVIKTQRRDELQAFMAKDEIGTLIHYPAPVHMQPAYGKIAVAPGGLPMTERLRGLILSLPMQPYLTEEDVEAVCSRLIAFDRAVHS
jgi:dTDP-4-amino-4,6-dideoxygalactose transaminase